MIFVNFLSNSELGRRLREQRKKNGYKSSTAFAKMFVPAPSNEHDNICNINTMRRKIERWEKGTAQPVMLELKHICSLLDCDPDYLWGTSPVARKATATASEHTGLFTDHVEMLANENGNSAATYNLYYNGTVLDGLNLLLQSEHFCKALRAFAKSYMLTLYTACNDAQLPANNLNSVAAVDALFWSINDKEKDIKESKICEIEAFKEFTAALAELSAHAQDKGKTLDWDAFNLGKISVPSYLKINSTDNK